MFKLGENWTILQSELESLGEVGIIQVTIDGEKVDVEAAASSGRELEAIKVRSSSGIEFDVIEIKNKTWTLKVTKEADPS